MDEQKDVTVKEAAKEVAANLMRVTCSHCQHEFPLTNVDERPCEIKGHSKVIEHGFSCPSCGEWSHAYFSGPKTKRYLATLSMKRSQFEAKRTQGNFKQWQKAKARYQKEFDAFQELIRPLAGVQSPAKIAEVKRNDTRNESGLIAAADAAGVTPGDGIGGDFGGEGHVDIN